MKLIKTLGALCLSSLLVACGGGGGAALGVLVEAARPSAAPNVAPVANAGITQNITLGYAGGVASKVVTLNGTGSTDGNGDTLTFKWFLTQKPAGSVAELSSTTDPKPTFTADVVGVYKVSLIVNDGKLDSVAPSVVTVTASISNSAPVANAGTKQTVVYGATSTVTLDGTYSTDADNNQIFYKWTLMQKPTGSSAALVGDTKARPTFIADVAGDYVVQLVVNDGSVDSLPSSVIVTATRENRAPTANAGEDKNVTKNTAVTLDGTSSLDPDFDTLTYKWSWMSYPSTTAPTLVATGYTDTSTSPKPSFTPTVVGTYVLTLTVSDGKLSSTADAITVTVSDTNNVPVAAAGADQNVLVSAVVTLNGTGSTDQDKLDTLTYKWSLNVPSGSSASLSSDTASQPTFTADVEGVYVASLVVNDSKASSANQSLTRVTASTTANSPPVATAGTSVSVTTATAVTLTGSGTDANSDTLYYRWYLVSKPTASTSTVVTASSTTATISVIPDVVGVYVVLLIINDGKADSNPATFTITRTL
ncbi:PKD domain-containing protein [Limnohabitans sp. Rim11]|uniref:PKD domain-containing protein n=1 Tax=Limnohabitans sp. Rim11 TaxID=1100719 RepID=UPI000A6C808C|nr:PKD domain-containing protein [Limnohabitans sp. Rim11]